MSKKNAIICFIITSTLGIVATIKTFANDDPPPPKPSICMTIYDAEFGQTLDVDNRSYCFQMKDGVNVLVGMTGPCKSHSNPLNACMKVTCSTESPCSVQAPD